MGIRRYTWLAVVTALILAINIIPEVAAYLERRWPDIALGGAIFIGLFLLGGFVYAPGGNRDRVLVLNWTLLFVYLLHQYEEHGIDLYGRVYFFYEYAGTVLEPRGLELTPIAILKINSLAVWLAYLIAIWGGRQFTWPGLAAAGIMLTNGLFHIAIAANRGDYNPGLATAIVLFLPVSIAYFRFVAAEIGHGWRAITAGIAFGIASHAMLPVLIGTGAGVPVLLIIAGLPLFINILSIKLSSQESGR